MCELLVTEPEAQCKVCLSYLDVASSVARAGTSFEMERRRTRNLSSTPWISSRYPNLLHKERATPRAPLREEARGPRVLHRKFAQEAIAKFYLGIHDRFIRDEKFRKNMCDIGRTEQICREMDKLADEDHTHHITPEEIRVKKTIGGFVRTQLVPIRCQFGIDLISSKHCQPCDSSKIKRMQLISIDGKAIPHVGGTGKNPDGILLMSITTKTDPALIDQGNLLKID